jgi:iron uptake system EfeUOB component EfeO/EfeM
MKDKRNEKEKERKKLSHSLKSKSDRERERSVAERGIEWQSFKNRNRNWPSEVNMLSHEKTENYKETGARERECSHECS